MHRLMAALRRPDDGDGAAAAAMADPLALFEKSSWEYKMVAQCRARLSVRPKKAHAVLFYSQHPDGSLDKSSKHGGCPVLKGTKWAANLWIWNRVRLGYPAAPRKAGAAPHDPNMRTSRDRIVHGNSHKQQQNTGGSFDHLSKLLSSNNKEQQAHDQQAQEDTVHDARQRGCKRRGCKWALCGTPRARLDAAGVGARDLKECLQLQLQRKFDSEDRSTAKLSRRISQRIALEILEFHFESFSKKHFERIQKKLDIDEEALKDALTEITQLNPKPGNSGAESSRGTAIQVVPDFLLSVEDNELRLQLNQRNAPELRISPMYKEMMETYASGAKTNSQQKDALTFVKQKIDSAKWFVDAIRQRQLTLTLTMQAIMDHQHDYFLSGDETDLRPMILKDIADVVQMDISTVSRVANSKYVQTPYGTFLLKSFFSESLTTETGEEVSSREVKKILQEAINPQEDKNPPSRRISSKRST